MAIGVEINNFYPLIPEITTLGFFRVITWLAAIALISHLIEGIIAAIVAYRKGLNPLKTGIYTFFTGTVGLVEVLKVS